jgi:RNA polymerase sigma-70 factor (ECF subfamily)
MCAIEADESDPPSQSRDLLDRARSGESDALEQLLHDNYSMIQRVCRRLTGNDADALDAAQDALIAVVRGIGGFDGRSAFSTWVYRIAVNASVDEMRRRSRRPVPGLEGAPDSAPSTSAGIGPVGANPGIDNVIDRSVERMDVNSALMTLPLEFRAPVVLRDICGLDYSEIAEVLDIPGGTVRSRIARGRSILVGVLAPLRDEEVG